MADTSLLIDVIKLELKAQDKTYADVAASLEMSESSVKRMFSRKEMPLTRVDDICRILNTDFAELSRRVTQATPLMSELTYEQEVAVSRDPKLLLTAICVLSYWTFEQMVQTYQITEAECTAKLLQLDKLGVIELKPLNRYRLKVAKTFKWRGDGPIRQYFLTHIVGEYFGGRFDREGETLLMVHGNINRSVAPNFVERLTRLGQDFSQQHLADQKIDAKHRDGFTMIVGFRRWEFSAFTGLRRPAEHAAPPA
ncbi:MAG: XRE family transcriptional regulator [Comamonadaceae bacterium]|nr:MAG: XRE family transcriptional regulator [Comamonadaceae bacterium]